jgi:hypothetical protein
VIWSWRIAIPVRVIKPKQGIIGKFLKDIGL